MSSQARALLAVALATVILFGAQFLLPQPRGPEAPSKKEATSTTTPPAAPPSGESVSSLERQQRREGPAKTPEREIIAETDVVRAVLTSRGGALKSWRLKSYPAADGQGLDLVAHPQEEEVMGPLLVSSGNPEEPAPQDFDIDKSQLNLRSSSETGTITFSSRGSGPLRVSKRLTFKSTSYRVEVEVSWKNAGKKPMTIAPELIWGPGFLSGDGNSRAEVVSATSWVDGSRKTDDPGSLKDPVTHSGRVSWTALQNLYFAAALLPEGQESVAVVRKGPGEQPVIALASPAQSLEPGAELTQRFAFYGGPKDLDHLKAAGADLSQLVDLGWFDALARPALHLLRFLNRISGNYGVAIILLTVLQKVVLHPLTAKSLRSMQAMKALQPKIAAISERNKNNAQKKQQEIMGLYRKHGVNPLGGCLPMLIQIPIFVALYNALSSSVEMWRAPFLWIGDLSRPDALFAIDVWGLKDYPFNLLALLMGVSMFFQQKMSPPSSSDPQQAKLMLWMMPIMFTFMFWAFPSGLVLYWLVNNVLQMGQQQWLQKRGKLALSGPEAS
ncbi:Inner membrane protein oxaA [Candidatus Methylomirabilis lanthanidiphila]|uniref:Membrane protein insertase YidC n=1 Tax=Candidatus Methylomirabilis lanthanidiphila TaxID=2211376 RepID=A0A564ZEL6_9BACT|nr:membrane protein insertase YidC [Candidatus Methylomirabilis lanthanidiphila]VUZ83761.1 Inner membrane protein oxaA [Candidatus Methylomirabilis lanthanidiphila]